MIALIQRVTKAQVDIDQQCVGKIGHGLVILLGVEKDDTPENADRLLQKIVHYRIFNDAQGKMNLDVTQVNGALLVVSQFTLTADTDKGRRPSFTKGATPEIAKQLYDYFVTQAATYVSTQTGVFAADMQVSLTNDGPVTFWLQA